MNYNEKRIKRAFKPRSWTEIKTSDSWQIFKIMGEFVDGFENMARIGPCVSIFGSARTEEDKEYYKLAEDIAFKLSGLIWYNHRRWSGIMSRKQRGQASQWKVCRVEY